MAYAYALSPGKEKSSALTNVRSGYKECTDTLCGLEVQIEQIIGTLSFEMKGMIEYTSFQLHLDHMKVEEPFLLGYFPNSNLQN